VADPEDAKPRQDGETDERLVESAIDRLRRDQDAKLLAGCVFFAIVATALTATLLVVFGALDPRTSASLRTASLAGGGVCVVIGFCAGLIGGQAGVFGSLGGMLPGALFVWLRLRDRALGLRGVEGMEPAEYAYDWSWAIPILLIAAVFSVSLLGMIIRERAGSRVRSDRGPQGL
jgi:hypothetical protein